MMINGEVISEPQWVTASNFEGGFAKVSNDEFDGFINSAGERVLEGTEEYERVRSSGDFQWKSSYTTSGGNWVGNRELMDRTGKVVHKGKYYDVNRFFDGLALVKIYKPAGSKYKYKYAAGYLDTDFNYAIEPQYGFAYSFKDGLAVVSDRNFDKWWVIDKSGEVVLDCEYIPLSGEISDGVLAVVTRQHLDDLNNDVYDVPAPTYHYSTDGNSFSYFTDPREFDDRTIWYKKIDTLWGYMDTEGNLIAEPQFVDAGPFKNGLAYFKTKEKEGYINKSGEIVWETERIK